MRQRPYEKLIVWRESYDLFRWIITLTKEFPPHERFEITSQMRTSSYSIPMNIAEGNAKRTAKDRKRFLNIAMGSLEELHCQVRIAFDLGYMKSDEYEKTNKHIGRVGFLLARFRTAQIINF